MLEHIYELLHDYQTYVRRKSQTGIMNWPVNPSGVGRWLEITILKWVSELVTSVMLGLYLEYDQASN